MEAPRFLVVLAILLVAYGGTESHQDAVGPVLEPFVWTHRLDLDPAGKFSIYWKPEDHQITMQLEAEALGYVGIGFSPTGGMHGADIVLTWVDPDTGTVVLSDRHGEYNGSPVVDAVSDYVLLGGYRNDTHTVVRFSREWDTCDGVGDLALGADTVRVIWSYHPSHVPSVSGAVMPYHGHGRRGTRSVFLREPEHARVRLDEPGVKAWELLADGGLPLPNDDHTHYWCRIFRAPDLNGRKHHMIGFEPVIEPGHESYVHHMVLYECHVPEESSDLYFAHHAKGDAAGDGERCYSPNMPPEWAYCLATNTWAWAVGSEGETLPDNVGIPLGEEHGGATYFMLETHYDNPARHQNVVDHSGLRIFYTDKLREFDTGMLLLGSEVNFLHVIPPRQRAFTTLGRCVKECTEQGLSPGGVKVLSGVLHSHLAGRKMRLRHLRDGRELPPILADESYDFNFQRSRAPAPESEGVVLPGDELLLECEYDTSARENVTHGGLSTREEMCLGFVLYYPRQELADCRSLPTPRTLTAALGVDAVFGRSLDKLTEFLSDIGGAGKTSSPVVANAGDTAETLTDFLNILAAETGNEQAVASLVDGEGTVGGSKRRHSIHRATSNKNKPLSYEELLDKPFYTVEGESGDAAGDLAAAVDYRTMMQEMLFDIRIESPSRLRNLTLAERVASMEWTKEAVSRAVQEKVYFGDHNVLCLAHGRRPLIEYKSLPFPGITSPPKVQENSKCHNADPRPPRFLRPLLQANVASHHGLMCSLLALPFLILNSGAF